MTKLKKSKKVSAKKNPTRQLFGELTEGVAAMREHREENTTHTQPAKAIEPGTTSRAREGLKPSDVSYVEFWLV